jgi:hypothetical protein
MSRTEQSGQKSLTVREDITIRARAGWNGLPMALTACRRVE